MIKLDIISGLLGAGKTTLIKQMLKTTYAGNKIAIIENEIGKVNLDAEELQNTNISVQELSSGCICCTVKGSFTKAIEFLAKNKELDYIVIEPSGMADISELVKACVQSEYAVLNRVIVVINAKKIQVLLKVVGDFFLDQIQFARTIFLNHTEQMTADQIESAKLSLWQINPELRILHMPLNQITSYTFPEGLPTKAAACEFRSTHETPVRLSRTYPKGTQMLPIRQNDLISWCYEFHCEFNEDDINKFFDILYLNECKGIWRVKGYLKMSNHRIKKVDYVFGDSFQENIDDFNPEKVNILIVIGKNFNPMRLRKHFKELEKK